MFKAVLKKRDGGKGSKKESGMWQIQQTSSLEVYLLPLFTIRGRSHIYEFIIGFGYDKGEVGPMHTSPLLCLQM